MAAQPRRSRFTGLRFENPFLLVVGAADRVGQQHHARLRRRLGRRRHQDDRPASGRQRPRARRPSSCARRPTRRTCRCRSARERRCTRRGTGSSSRTSRSTGGCRASRGSSRRIPRACSWPRSWPARAATTSSQHWQTLATACQDEGADALELNLSCPHMDRKDMGSQHRQGPGAHLDRRRGGEGGRARAGVGQAHALDHRHRRGSARRVPRRRRRDLVVEHLSVAAAHRSRDARVRDERRRVRLERRAGRPGHPAAVDGQDGAADAGVSRQGVFRHRRRSPSSRTRSTTSCSAAARCRCARRRCSTTRSARTSSPASRAACAEFLERHADRGWTSVEDFRGLRRDRVVTHSQIRRPDAKEYLGGHDAEGYAAARRHRPAS